MLRALVITALLPAVLPAYGDETRDDYRLLELEGFKVKWGHHELGAGASISYAFADEAMRFDGARNCSEMAPLGALSGTNLPLEALHHEAAAAFQIWESAANLAFHRVADPRTANIVIGAQARPIGRAFANVSHGPDAREGVRLIEQALVCLNPEQKWKIGFDGNTEVYDIRYTLIHEIGHAIGLDHPGPDGQIMGFRYTEMIAGLQPGDLRGIRLLYGLPTSGGELAATGANTRTTESTRESALNQAGPALSIK